MSARPPLSARDIALAALMAAVIEVLKVALASVPNVELTSFFVILFALHFGRPALYAIPVFILIEGLLYGFGLWWVMYLYAWPLLALGARALRLEGAFSCALLSGAFGLCFGLLCSFPYFFIGAAGGGVASGLRHMASWWIAGIPFDLVHGVSNFFIMLALYAPFARLFARLKHP